MSTCEAEVNFPLAQLLDDIGIKNHRLVLDDAVVKSWLSWNHSRFNKQAQKYEGNTSEQVRIVFPSCIAR